jgi:hypothetical protein
LCSEGSLPWKVSLYQGLLRAEPACYILLLLSSDVVIAMYYVHIHVCCAVQQGDVVETVILKI